MWWFISIIHLLKSLFIFQLKDHVSVKAVSLSGDKLDHRKQMVTFIG